MAPEELRVKAATILARSATPGVAVPVVVSTDSQFEPEKVAPSAPILSCACSAAISVWILALLSALAPVAATSLSLISLTVATVFSRAEYAVSTLPAPRPRASCTTDSELLSERIVVAIDQ